MKFQRDWSEFLEIFGRHGVRFLLVGAHALAAHGRVRATLDLDVFIESTAVNARRVGAALADFGFGHYREAWKLFTTPYQVTMLGRVPHRIDILTRISGVTFKAAWRNRCELRGFGSTIAVLSLRDLIKNKRASGRAKDLADLALLAEAAAVKPIVRPRRRAEPKPRPAQKAGRRRGRP